VDLVIKQATYSDSDALAALIRDSFRDVADRFRLTPTNAPTHPSNCEPNWIRDDLARSVSYISLARGTTNLGCIAVEPLVGSMVELKRLAVLPEHRRQGLGAQLVHRGIEQACSAGATKVEVSVIADHLDLIRWYERLGFARTATRRFSHLPFTVAYLTRSP